MTSRVVVGNKFLLIDLDGTLTDTANLDLKPMKDGQVPTDVSQIQIFPDAVSFLAEVTQLGFNCIVVSDSHPKYVNPIVNEYFNEYCIASFSLADKPNTFKTLAFLQQQGIDITKDVCYVVGDSWLDIELGRGLKVPTILTNFYEAGEVEVRDGIGDYIKNIKSSSTYFTRSYLDIVNILQNPLENLLCIEAKFSNSVSIKSRKPRLDDMTAGKLTAHRVLARQSQGECDQYHATEKYFEFSRVDRKREMLLAMRDAITGYLDCVLSNASYSWHIFTYVPDKQTTQPANKMGELFDFVAEYFRRKRSNLDCYSVFEWNEAVNSSTRKQPTSSDRKKFVEENLNLRGNVDVRDKNVIILDDQYTTGATADVLIRKLRIRGAKSVLFIALFHLITNVSSNRLCPVCSANSLNKPLQLKINKQTGEKFYSCVSPKYGGEGCGYNDSGKICSVCLSKGTSRYMKVRTNNQTGEKFYACVSPKYGGKGCGHTESLE